MPRGAVLQADGPHGHAGKRWPPWACKAMAPMGMRWPPWAWWGGYMICIHGCDGPHGHAAMAPMGMLGSGGLADQLASMLLAECSSRQVKAFGISIRRSAKRLAPVSTPVKPIIEVHCRDGQGQGQG